MADPGERFTIGCVPEYDKVTKKLLPHSRFVFAALSKLSDRYCIVAFEQGGYAYSRNVSLFHLSEDGKSADLVGVASIDRDVKSLATLRRAEQKKPLIFTRYTFGP
jgi:hypothetical protein